jgi:hypothetical protein
VSNVLKYHFATVAILACAIFLYALGSNGGGSILLLCGGAMELWFWIRALRIGAKKSTKHLEESSLSH